MKNPLIDNNPHLKSFWKDVSDLMDVCFGLYNEKNEHRLKTVSFENKEWTLYIKENYLVLVEAVMIQGYTSKGYSMASHPDPDVQLYIDALSIIRELEAILYFINKN